MGWYTNSRKVSTREAGFKKYLIYEERQPCYNLCGKGEDKKKYHNRNRTNASQESRIQVEYTLLERR